MDKDTISVLKTVCAAGSARAGFNDDSNQRLEQLVDAGLLDEVNLPTADSKIRLSRKFYRPTEKGRAMVQKLGVA